MNVFWFIFIVLLGVVIWNIARYNTLVRLKENRQNTFSDIKEQLDKRHEVISHLVHEVKEVDDIDTRVQAILKAKEEAKNSLSVNDRISAERKLTTLVNRLDLNKISLPPTQNKIMMKQQKELRQISERIDLSSHCFNNTTREFNAALQKFPQKMLSKVYGFEKQPLFDAIAKQDNY